MSAWELLPKEERIQLLAYDELERDERHAMLKDTEKVSTELLLAWIWLNG